MVYRILLAFRICFVSGAVLLAGCGGQSGGEKSNSVNRSRNPDSVKVDFDHSDQIPGWEIHTNGGEVRIVDGELKVQGKTKTAGWTSWNGLSSSHFPEGDFTASVRFKVGKLSGKGSKLVTLDALENSDDPNWVSLWLSQNEKYGMNTGPQKNPTPENVVFAQSDLALFGDEAETFHQLQLIYDHTESKLTGFVDEKPVGELDVQLKGGVTFSLRVATESDGVEFDVTYDDFHFASESD